MKALVKQALAPVLFFALCGSASAYAPFFHYQPEPQRHHFVVEHKVTHKKIEHRTKVVVAKPILPAPRPARSTVAAMIQKTVAAALPPVISNPQIGDDADSALTDLVSPPPRNPVEDARTYVQLTSYPGYTMFLQGSIIALSCLNPDFVMRLADAIKDARANGIRAGVSSACRPPALGIGGMRDKSESMHAYGLAVDMSGVGRPGSDTANRWYVIAANHGLIHPYSTPWEWNHMQPTDIKVARQVPAMKRLMSAYGPTDLDRLWRIEAHLLLPVDKAQPQVSRDAITRRPEPIHYDLGSIV